VSVLVLTAAPVAATIMTADEILARLADIRQRIEAHAAAQWLLEREADELRGKLRAAGWEPPAVTLPADPARSE
jgi:hypothetical protein